MKEEKIYLTGEKVWTEMEVVDYFSGKISDKNIPALVEYLIYENLSEQVISCTEQNGILFLNVGTGKFISVTYLNKNK